jgi:ferredoxin
MSERLYEVDARKCICCAACASIAPGLFVVDGTAARVVRAPADDAERWSCEAAVLLCPTSTIRRRELTDGR